MKRIFIIHRWSGGPNDDWRPWLKNELETAGYQVFTPQMPDTHTPNIQKWVNHLRSTVDTPDDQTFFIGHSIGCQAILRYLETISNPVGGAIFVSGWFNLANLEDEETKATAEPWITTPINLQKIRTTLPKSTLIISDNDPYNYFEDNQKKFAELGTKIIVLHNAGHITDKDGFTKLPILIEELIRIENNESTAHH